MYYFIRILIYGCLFWISSVFSIEVTPMVITLSPLATSEIPSSVVYNKLPRDVAFDIEIYEVKFDKSGETEPKLIPLDDSPLWVFPPLLYLKPGKSQRIQFRWLGEKIPLTDKTYQVSLIEQPIKNTVKEEKSKLTILLDVNLIVHVDQLKLTPKLYIENPQIKKNFLISKVINSGPGFGRLSDYNISIISKGKEVGRYDKGEFKSKGYDVFFPPNSVAFIKIPLPESIMNKGVDEFRLELFD